MDLFTFYATYILRDSVQFYDYKNQVHQRLGFALEEATKGILWKPWEK
jgi:hypothetical protein